MSIQLGSPGPIDSPQPARKRRSVIGKLFRGAGWLAAGPVDWVGVGRIRRGASFIGDLVALLSTGPRRDTRFRTDAAGAFDLRATAFLHGVSAIELEHRLAARRRQTARIAYAAFALACLFLLGWLWQALSSPWTATRVASAIEFLPFCGLFFLIAFYNALLNFQIRTGRTASWREYLATTQRFLPW